MTLIKNKNTKKKEKNGDLGQTVKSISLRGSCQWMGLRINMSIISKFIHIYIQQPVGSKGACPMTTALLKGKTNWSQGGLAVGGAKHKRGCSFQIYHHKRGDGKLATDQDNRNKLSPVTYEKGRVLWWQRCQLSTNRAVTPSCSLDRGLCSAEYLTPFFPFLSLVIVDAENPKQFTFSHSTDVYHNTRTAGQSTETCKHAVCLSQRLLRFKWSVQHF